MVEVEVRPGTRTGTENIMQTLSAYGRFNTLVSAIRAAGLEDALNGPGPFTVFAPTDEAFNQLPRERVDNLLNDPKGQLKKVILYHVVQDSLTTEELAERNSVKTCEGDDIELQAKPGTMTTPPVTTTERPVTTTTERPVTTTTERGTTTTTERTVTTTTTEKTIPATTTTRTTTPTTTTTSTQNEGHVMMPDITCSNGIIHAIDAVLIPPT